jgi:hypothetical protein
MKARGIFGGVSQLFLLGVLLVLAGFTIYQFSTRPTGEFPSVEVKVGLEQQTQVTSDTGYPPPTDGMSVTPERITETPKSPGKPLSTIDFALATQVAQKKGTPLSPAEVNLRATELAYRKQSYTPVPMIEYSYMVATINELAEVVYHSNMIAREPIRTCVSAQQPGTSTLIKSIDKRPNFYILPFYRNNAICALAILRWENGLGYLDSIGPNPGTDFPQITASNAVNLVEKSTGKKVAAKPNLVYGLLQEALSQFLPFWEVTTDDQQVYFVFYRPGGNEGQSSSPKEEVMPAENIHPIN